MVYKNATGLSGRNKNVIAHPSHYRTAGAMNAVSTRVDAATTMHIPEVMAPFCPLLLDIAD